MEDAELQPGNDLERQAGSGLLRRNKSVDGVVVGQGDGCQALARCQSDHLGR